eukprot:6182388-Pleurochrysis_carterae.AAC.4
MPPRLVGLSTSEATTSMSPRQRCDSRNNSRGACSGSARSSSSTLQCSSFCCARGRDVGDALRMPARASSCAPCASACTAAELSCSRQCCARTRPAAARRCRVLGGASASACELESPRRARAGASSTAMRCGSSASCRYSAATMEAAMFGGCA